MALLGFEGFDSMATGNTADIGNLNNVPISTSWTTTASNAKNAALVGGSAIGPINGSIAIFNYPSNANPVFVGMRFQPSALTSLPWELFRFADSAGTVQCGVALNASGFFFVYRASTANVLATGSTTSVVANAWYYLELGLTLGTGVSGSVTLRVNGNTEATNGACNSQNGLANTSQVQLISHGVGFTPNFDDFYCLDNTGGAPLNTFLPAPVRVETLFPTTNNSVTFTPLTSTNVSQISEVNVDGDTSYNSTSTHANVDNFNHGSLVSTPSTIYAAKVQTRSRKDDITALSAKTQLVSGVTTVTGNSYALQTVYQEWWDTYTTDPNTAAAWTGANVNATKIGYTLV